MDEIITNSEQKDELKAENQQESAVPLDEDASKSLLRAQKIENLKKYRFQKGMSGNPKGRRKGIPNYSTLFNLAMKGIAKKLNLKNGEIELIQKGLIEAFKGNYSFYRDALDRKFGRPKETIDVQGGALPVILEITRGRDRNEPEPEPEPELEQPAEPAEPERGQQE